MTALLEVKNIETYYGPIMAIAGVSLKVSQGDIITILANGAGKTTLLKTISGAIDCRKGQILFKGEEIQNRDPDIVAGKGIGHVPEGREVFPFMSVKENLLMGAYHEHKKRNGVKPERKNAAIAMHFLVGVSPDWLAEAGDPNDLENPRVMNLIEQAKTWSESWMGKGAVWAVRYDIDEMGSGVVDILASPIRQNRSDNTPFCNALSATPILSRQSRSYQ